MGDSAPMTFGRGAVGSVLLLGANGMLGGAWRRLLDSRGIDHADLDLPQFDMTDPAQVDAAIDGSHAYVVNCAAYTAVDDVETNEQIATRVNGDAPGLLATRCRVAKATLVHYSTDYVFNGRAQEPYPVDAPRDPVNAYGRTKALGEENIERAGGGYLIVRTSWLYAPWGKNFVRTIARAAAQRDSLRVVDDQRGRPTSSTHLAASTLGLIESGATGMFHVTDGGECTWFDLAAAIVANVDPSCRVEPCTTDEYPTPAARPEYSVLDVSLTEQRLGPMPDWRQNLAEVLDHLEPLT